MYRDRYLFTLVLFAISLALAFDPRASAADGRCASFRALGYDDGAEGLDARFDARAAGDVPCSPTSPRDRDQYTAGWQAGIRKYCEPNHAFALGNSGESYRNACRGAAAAAFHDAYYAGRQLFLEESAIGDLEDTLAAHSRELVSLDADLATAEARAVSSAASADERVEWSIKAKHLADTRRDVAAEVDDLELEIRSRKNDLATLRESVADSE